MFNPTESLTGATAIADTVAPLEASLAAVKARLCAFEQSLGANAALLRKAIEQGIDDCAQHSSD